jgi:hypothetical protein
MVIAVCVSRMHDTYLLYNKHLCDIYVMYMHTYILQSDPKLFIYAQVIFLIPWFIYVIYLASSGDTINVDATTSTGEAYAYRKFVYTENTKYAFIYMLFCWFWTSEFILAIGQLTIALAVVAFYFNRDKKKIGNLTVLWVSYI